jgi:hypothetical protein
VQFNRLHEKLAPDTAALAGAMIASRWCGEVLEFSGFKVSADIADAVRLIVPDAKFVQPVDGFRRNLCEGHMHLLVSQPGETMSVLEWGRSEGRLTRLVTWSGEFIAQGAVSSAGRIAGEISTNADLLLPAWETSVCLGLLVGGMRLGAIVVPKPNRHDTPDVERIAYALRIVGIHLQTVAPGDHEGSASLAERLSVDAERRQPQRREHQRSVRLAATAGSRHGRH